MVHGSALFSAVDGASGSYVRALKIGERCEALIQGEWRSARFARSFGTFYGQSVYVDQGPCEGRWAGLSWAEIRRAETSVRQETPEGIRN